MDDRAVFEQTACAAFRPPDVWSGYNMTSMPPMKNAARQMSPWQQRLTEAAMLGNLGQPFSIEGVADACNLSTRHFTRLFNATYGLTPLQWLMQRRVEWARQLLTETNWDVGTIASHCGFADGSHLARVFRQSQFESPTAFRRRRDILKRRRLLDADLPNSNSRGTPAMPD